MNDVQRSIDRARSFRFAAVCGVVLDVVLIALDLARGSATALAPAVLLTGLLALVIVQTRLIGTMQRARDLNERAEQLELEAEAVKSRARPCAHPDAEPVDLSTGERVAWVCPDCDAELPANWILEAKGTGTIDMSAARALSGAGTLTAKATLIPAGTCTCPPGACAPVGVGTYADGSPVVRYCGACGKRIREDEDTRDFASGGFIVASQGIPTARVIPVDSWDDVAYASEASRHFAALARVGQEFCLSYCPICAPRLAARVFARHGPGVIAGDDYFTPADMALMRSGATFGSDATVTLPSGKKMTGAEIQRWIENDQAQQWIDKGRWGSGE